MFDRFVCDLLSFCACEFPAKSETREPRKIIAEHTTYMFRKIILAKYQYIVYVRLNTLNITKKLV